MNRFDPIHRRDFLAGALTAATATTSAFGRPPSAENQNSVEPPGSLTFLCLDPREFAAGDDFDHRVCTARKDPDRPIFEPAAGQFDSQRVFNHGTVLHDGGRFRMWYGGMGPVDKSRPWWEWLRACYAESEDGLHWRRKAATADGSHVIPHLSHTCCVFKDETAEDTDRKYVSLDFSNSGEQRLLAERGEYDPKRPMIPGRLLTSPDGLSWQQESAQVAFAGPKPWSFIPQCIFRDQGETDPARLWKAYGFASINQQSRAGFYAYSGDARNWTAPAVNPVLNPVVRGAPADAPGPDRHIHDAVVWRQAGYYLAFYQYLYGKEQADVELAVSRDGQQFTFVNPGGKVIARGKAGQWDRGEILPTPPVVVGDEIWLYYGGSDYYHPSDGPHDRARSDSLRVCTGLARLQRDRLAYLQPKPGGSDRPRLARSNSLRQGTWRLFINADCSDDHRLAVEVLPEMGESPLPGYSTEKCEPLTQNDLRQAVRWNGNGEFDAATQQTVRVRFHFQGRPKLFGYAWKPV